MYQSETMDAVRSGAQTLTREGKVLTVGSPEFPLAVFADTYQVDDAPTNTELPQEEMVAVEEFFDEINQDSTPADDDSREAMVDNLFTAISKVQFNTTNIIIPSIKAMHTQYANLQQGVGQPEYSVKPWRYLAPHNSPVLVNHVNTRYTNVQPKDTYKSYELERQAADAIIEMMAINNPHMEQEEVTEWALQVGAERIEAVWASLFMAGGQVMPAGLPYLNAVKAPFNVDDILVAYFICGHYIDNPAVVPNESVDLEDWEHTMKLMHEMFGFYLMRAYLRRVEYRETGVLILKNEAINPIDTRRAVVIVNGDVFDPWVVGGGDIQAVLGAAIENSGVTDLKYIVAGADKFIARWHAIYPQIKQAAIDYADRQRNSNVIATFREVSRSELLKERYSSETEAKLKEALRYLRRDDYDNPYKVFSTLICRVYFPETTYIEYLDAIDSFGQDFPKASMRELNTQALISLVAIFSARQVVVEDFLPEIDPNAAADGGAMNDSGLLAVVDFDEEETAEVVDVDTSATDEVVEGSDTTTDETVDADFGSADVAESTEETVEAEVDTESELEFNDSDEEEDPYADLEEPETEVEETTEAESTGDVSESESTEETEEVAADAEEASESEESTAETEEDEEEDETPLA